MTLLKKSLSPIPLFGLLCATLSAYSLYAATPGDAVEGAVSQAERLDQFTHQAYIPADADINSIHFERISLVKVATATTRQNATNYCAQLIFREPGGSSFCPDVRMASMVSAYRMTFSYMAPPLASDEFSNRRFTFDVYFHPEEISSQIRSELRDKSTKGASAERYFSLTFHDRQTNRTVVDSAHSTFCDGEYVDGLWTLRTNGCADSVRYTTTLEPSGYIVSVERALFRLRTREISDSPILNDQAAKSRLSSAF